MARVFGAQRTLLDPVFQPIERLILGIVGVNPNDQAEGQDWKALRPVAGDLKTS